jgi:hypothetical protein
MTKPQLSPSPASSAVSAALHFTYARGCALLFIKILTWGSGLCGPVGECLEDLPDDPRGGESRASIKDQGKKSSELEHRASTP